MTAIAGVDEAICADFQMGKSAALGAGRKWRARHHGTAHCDGARGCGFDLGRGDAALVSSRGRHPAVRNGFSLAARATAGSKEACLTEDHHVGHTLSTDTPGRGPAYAFRRAPHPDHARAASAGAMSLIGKLSGHRARHHCRIEVERGQLIEEGFDIERMMQRNRSAKEEPRHERDR
jgi:hypothetical protein